MTAIASTVNVRVRNTITTTVTTITVGGTVEIATAPKGMTIARATAA